MERSHAQEQVSAVHSGHIEIEDRKIEGGKIATQCLYRGTKQYNCVALQLQNFPAKCQFQYVIVDAEDPLCAICKDGFPSPVGLSCAKPSSLVTGQPGSAIG
jgi:hypothetical protein